MHREFAQPVAVMGLTPSVLKRLSEVEIYMIGDVAAGTRRDIIRLHGIGWQTANHIEEQLAIMGLTFGMEKAHAWQMDLWGYEPSDDIGE